MKKIHVVAAIIQKENKILATQRGYGPFKGQWEFPGGKVNVEELPADALIREINEELAANINVLHFFATITHQYPDFFLHMDCFLCSLTSESIQLLEHQDAKWLSKNELEQVKWLPADLKLIPQIKSHLK